jgi:hypothetical protein
MAVETEHMKIWALEQAVVRGKTKPSEKILEEAGKFYAFISGKPQTEIMEIKMGCKGKGKGGRKK